VDEELIRIGHIDDPNLAEVYAASLRSEGIPVMMSGGVAMYPTRVGYGARTYFSVPTGDREDALTLLEGSDMVLGPSVDKPLRGDWYLLAGIGIVLGFLVLVQALR